MTARHAVDVRLTETAGVVPSQLKPILRVTVLEPLYRRYRGKGLTGVEIADRLGISPSMARTDLRALAIGLGRPAGPGAMARAVSASAAARRERIAARTVKTCPQCRRELPLDEFGLDRQRADGHMKWCRECANQRARDRRAARAAVPAIPPEPESAPRPLVRTCPACGRELPRTAFLRSARCKECVNSVSREKAAARRAEREQEQARTGVPGGRAGVALRRRIASEAAVVTITDQLRRAQEAGLGERVYRLAFTAPVEAGRWCCEGNVVTGGHDRGCPLGARTAAG